MRKKGVLITGIDGLLGSALKKKLLEKGYQVYDIGLDVSDAKKVLGYDFTGKKIDWIVHTAAITDMDLCEKDKRLCSKVNFEGTKNIVDLAKKIGARLLYISTVSVFSGEKGNYKENDRPDPKNFYNQTKLQGEQAVLSYNPGLVLRINLIGVHPSGSRGKNFFEWLVDSIKADKDMQLFSDVMINPLSNWTIAELIEKIIDRNLSEKILHIASRNVLSKADIAKLAVEKITSYKGNLKFVSVDDIGRKAFRPKQMWLNTDFAHKKLNFKMPSLESEIEKILQKIKK
jgi:dTDP-4-dehydrorhamnose reductase